MRIHHLACGHMRPALAPAMVCHCLLIETPASGLVLVDSGFAAADLATPDARLPPFFRLFLGLDRNPEHAAISQIRRLGLDPRDVRHIVLTHLDVDHASGLVDFPTAAVHVHALEAAAAADRRDFRARNRYVPAMWENRALTTYQDVGERWHGFDAVHDLTGLPPEILLIPLLGHSRGHSAIAVDTGRGWLLHAGDAYFAHDEVHARVRRCPPALSLFQSFVEVDRKARLDNQDRLRDLAHTATDVEVFSAHDARELRHFTA